IRIGTCGALIERGAVVRELARAHEGRRHAAAHAGDLRTDSAATVSTVTRGGPEAHHDHAARTSAASRAAPAGDAAVPVARTRGASAGESGLRRIDDGDLVLVAESLPVERNLRRRRQGSIGLEDVDVVILAAHDGDRPVR